MLLRVQGRQLRRFGSLVRMSPGCLPLESFYFPDHAQLEGDPRVHPEPAGDSHLAWENFLIGQEELESVAG